MDKSYGPAPTTVAEFRPDDVARLAPRQGGPGEGVDEQPRHGDDLVVILGWRVRELAPSVIHRRT
ncbi:hypothetical protein AB0D34_08945 [Streptomyces sp. NPDC048420]|uniref:hypothetical protein n=1 Tax=Streptomyces sp. NPDC048420 TaxID=3155755 RepID=UPI00341431C2